MDHTMHPELDNVLQSLLLNGYSVFSLIDDILAHDRNRQEDQRIMLLRGGVERDAADICARLLGHDPTSASVFAWAHGAQTTQRSAVEEKIGEERGPHSTADHRLSLQNNFGRVQSKDHRRGATIDVLPDNAFLEIFDFCLREPNTTRNRMQVVQHMKKWQILVQVCQRWRRTIFASPQRLDLHLSCSYGTPVRQNLGFWPASLPLTIDYPGRLDSVYGMGLAPEDEDNLNVLAALRHASRVHRIDILASGPLLKCMVTVMQKPFPALVHLDLKWDTKVLPARGAPILPDGRFLSGTAPRLQYLRLKCVSFPYLPTFLLSARNLVTLKLKDIYQNGYISPEAMVEGLAVLTRLKTLSISFRNGTSPPDQMGSRPDPPMRITLPALTAFHYIGRCEYLEDFLAQIDTPQLYDLRIEYFKRQIQATQLSRFVDRTENLKLYQFSRAKATFFYEDIYVEFDCPQGNHRQARLSLKILGQAWLDAQVPCVAHVLGQLVPLFSKVDHLDAHGDHVHSREIDITDWLPFFSLFAAVKTLHLSGGVAAYITSALEDAADPEDMITDVFPVLRLIWLDKAAEDEDEDEDEDDEPVGSIEQFLSMRQLSDHPVTVVGTEDEFDRRR